MCQYFSEMKGNKKSSRQLLVMPAPNLTRRPSRGMKRHIRMEKAGLVRKSGRAVKVDDARSMVEST